MGCPDAETLLETLQDAGFAVARPKAQYGYREEKSPGAVHSMEGESMAEESGRMPFDEEMALEDAVASLAYTVHRQPLNREVLYAILRLCVQEREVGFVERAVLAMPEYAQATQNPFRLVCFLVDHGGLCLMQRDAEGGVIDEERRAQLGEDEFDDLLATESLVSTEAGRRLLELAAPQRRMGLLLESEPERAATYVEVLEFIRDRHPAYGDIKALLAGRDILHAYLDGRWADIQPSVFVDKLEGAGMILWRDGWELTEEGALALQRIKESAAA